LRQDGVRGRIDPLGNRVVFQLRQTQVGTGQLGNELFEDRVAESTDIDGGQIGFDAR